MNILFKIYYLGMTAFHLEGCLDYWTTQGELLEDPRAWLTYNQTSLVLLD